MRHNTSTRCFSLLRQVKPSSNTTIGVDRTSFATIIARRYSIKITKYQTAPGDTPGSPDTFKIRKHQVGPKYASDSLDTVSESKEQPESRVQPESKEQQVELSPLVLRDACKCPQCVDPSDRQRNYSYAEIPTNIAIKSQKTTAENKVVIEWTNDINDNSKHQSIFSPADFEQLSSSYRNPKWDFYQRPRHFWNKKSYTAEKNKRVDYEDYMSQPTALAEALHQLWQNGLVFIKQVPNVSESVKEIVERIGPLQNTFYGPTWDVRSVPQAKNVAYTSRYLGFHMDLLYMRDPPGLQFLHCIENSCTGGESRFADTFHTVDELYSQENGPEMYQDLLRHKVRYEYDNDGFFYSDLKPTICQATETPRGRTLNATNPHEMRKLAHVYWSPPFVGSLDPTHTHGRLQQFIKASKAFSDIQEDPENVIEEKMESGTCVIFDNTRVVHARNEFDVSSGKRWLKGAYLAHQDFISKAVSHEVFMPKVTGPFRRYREPVPVYSKMLDLNV